jgi:ergothioneine biosynthesis protein EgtB
MHRRDLRGLISRPTVADTRRFRAQIDDCITDLISGAGDELFAEIEPLLVLGIHHEQQHQELLLTDIKHVLAQNPLFPVYREAKESPGSSPLPLKFVPFEETICHIGHGGRGFAYDNEGPRHRALVPAFALANRPVTNGEYIQFIESGGYTRPEFWLSLGWMTVNAERWNAPLYWTRRDAEWWHFTLSGFRRVEPDEPVTHLSYFEADAYANWAGARLPTEFEWERAAADLPIEGNFVDSRAFHPLPVSPALRSAGTEKHHEHSRSPLQQIFGDVWEWTRSSYSPYPGYRAAAGALGEYNGKFMCNQYVLRGGSCATSRSHLRHTYRNFFQPEKRWQFTGLRLARDLA